MSSPGSCFINLENTRLIKKFLFLSTCDLSTAAHPTIMAFLSLCSLFTQVENRPNLKQPSLYSHARLTLYALSSLYECIYLILYWKNFLCICIKLIKIRGLHVKQSTFPEINITHIHRHAQTHTHTDTLTHIL